MIREKYCRYTCGRCGLEPREEHAEKDCDYDFSHEIKRKKKSTKNKKKKGKGKRVKSVKKLYRSSYVDPCECTTSGISGSVDTGRKGCFTYSPRSTGLAWLSWLLDSRGGSRGTDICYVTNPDQCRHAEKSNHFPGAKWRRCHK